jgi:hypothetical protein
MKKLIPAILLLMLAASLAFSVQQPANWITYTSVAGRYSISLPQQPTLKTQESTTADGEKFPQYVALVAEADGVVMLIGHFDMVPGTIFSAEVARDSMVKSVSGKLLEDKVISLSGYPGHDLSIALKLPATTAAGEPPPTEYSDRARIYEVDRRVYILQIIFPKSLEGEAMNARVAKYFDSFQLIKN